MHRRIIKCIQSQDWFAAIDMKDTYFHISILPQYRPFLRFAFECRAWQYRVLPFGLSLSSRVFTKVVEGALTPLREVGVRLGEYDSMPHGRAHPSSAELPTFLQRQECGATETVSEAPGAYGIRSWSHATRVASYETTSALATRPCPEMGMAPRYISSKHHSGVSLLIQPLDGPCHSMGRGAPRTSIPAYCFQNRCLQHGLGRYMQWAGSLGALNGAPTALAHQLPRAVGSAFSLTAAPATTSMC